MNQSFTKTIYVSILMYTALTSKASPQGVEPFISRFEVPLALSDGIGLRSREVQESRSGPASEPITIGLNFSLDATTRSTEDPFGNTTESDSGLGTLNVSVGKYLDKNNEVGMSTSLTSITSSTSGTESTTAILGIFGYYRRNIAISPQSAVFFGTELGLNTNSSESGGFTSGSTEFVIGIPVGLKYFLADIQNVSIDTTLKLNLGVGSDDFANVTTTTGVVITVGFTFYI